MNISKKSLVFSENEKFFSNCSLKTEEMTGRLLSVNSKFLAMLTKNRGEIVIVGSSNPCDLKENKNYNRIKSNYYGEINDIEFSPHNSNILASANKNYLLLWKIPDENFNNITMEKGLINHEHNNKINYITFNPVVKDILCTGDLNNEIFVWNDEKLESYNKFQLDESASMIEYNPKGDLIGITTTKQYMNILDPRQQSIILKKEINKGHFTPKFVWVDDNSFAVIGSNLKNKSQKMIKLWDIRKIKEGDTDKGEIASVTIEKSKYISSTPYINRELKLIYVIKKLSSSIDVFNYNEGNFEKETYDINIKPDFLMLLNKNSLDENKKEKDRFVICSDDNIYFKSVFSFDEYHLENIDNNISISTDEKNIIFNNESKSIKEENLESKNGGNLNDENDNKENIIENEDKNNDENKDENNYENNDENKDENNYEGDIVNYNDENINEIKDENKNENIKENINENIKEITNENKNENINENIKENNIGNINKNNDKIKDENIKENYNEFKDNNINEIKEDNNDLKEEKLEEQNQNQNDIINDSDKNNKLNNTPSKEEENNRYQNFEEFEENINNILNENELLRSENDKLKNRNKKSLKVKEEYNLKAKECLDLFNKNIKLNKKVEEKEKIISKKNEEINEYEKKISKLEKEKESKEQEIEDKNKQIDVYKNKISNLENEIQKEKEKNKVKEMNSSKINEEIKLIKEKYEKILKEELEKIESSLMKKMENKFNKYENILKKKQIIFNKMNESMPSCEAIHYGIKCEKCFQEPIKGIRYKCWVCSDYNLCDKCEEKNSLENEHPHNFIKIRKDQNNNQINFSNYSYKCIKIWPEILEIFDGTEQANFEITLKNNGDEVWPKDKTKLSFDNESDLTDKDIELDPQMPGEEKNYSIIFTGLGDKNLGEYISNLCFFIKDKQIGEKLTLKIKILDSRVQKFANEKELSLSDFPYKRLLDALRENNFDFEKAFESLF